MLRRIKLAVWCLKDLYHKQGKCKRKISQTNIQLKGRYAELTDENQLYVAFSWANVLKVTEKSHSFLKWTSPEKWAPAQAIHLLSSRPQTYPVSHEIASGGKLWSGLRWQFITFWNGFQNLKIGKTLHKKLDTSLHDESHWTKKIAAFNFLFTGQELK